MHEEKECRMHFTNFGNDIKLQSQKIVIKSAENRIDPNMAT